MGFSNPMSNGMMQLVLNILSKSADKQDKFWLCSDSGGEGERKNVWLMAQGMKTNIH